MPEGDTIFRTAVNLRAAIKGQVVNTVECRDPALPVESLIRQRVADIEARGKHLLIRFGNQRVLHSHMGMTGSWHVYPPGEPWKKPTARAGIRLDFDQAIAVCFSPKTLELLTSTALQRHRHLRQLGPDILADLPNTTEMLRRFRVHAHTPIGEALLNQTIVCGVGNVYKSEVLFLARINPFHPVAMLGDDMLLEVLELASNLMRRNLAGYPRRTRFSGDSHRQWVYGRQGDPCFECGTAITMRRQGDTGRSTYWCPTCQCRNNPVGNQRETFQHPKPAAAKVMR